MGNGTRFELLNTKLQVSALFEERKGKATKINKNSFPSVRFAGRVEDMWIALLMVIISALNVTPQYNNQKKRKNKKSPLSNAHCLFFHDLWH